MKPFWNRDRGLSPHEDLATVEMKGVAACIAVALIIAVIVGECTKW